MSTTILQDVNNDPSKGLNILSFDAGGPRGISQLQILQNIMNKTTEDAGEANDDTNKRPCDVFDAIGGVGTGGLIAIFLVMFKMTIEEALVEFTQFITEVFKDISRDPKKQTEKLKRSIDEILIKHGIDQNLRLIPENVAMPSCRLMVPIMYKNNATASCVLRNYTIRDEPSTNLTLAEAMLATCAAPPIFTPTKISKEFTTFEYISGDVALSNPTREIIAEAHRAFGSEATVACLLSIGSGHPGTTSAPSGSDMESWMGFFQRVAMDSEKTAREIGKHMVQLDLYHRLSVIYGLESPNSHTWNDPAIISTHTTSYLGDAEVMETIVRCADMLNTGAGFTTLEQLNQAGGAKILPPPLPPLASTYVERKDAMDFVEQSIFDDHGTVKEGSKIVVVTGIGGCGKTQLIRKFGEKHGHQFSSVFFVDGSSKDTLQRDMVRYVRSLGRTHSQASFDESMVYLSQPAPGQRLLVIDNVDDLALDLSPFLPRWKSGTVIVTSRNPSRGQLSPKAHLQLDVMTLHESVELLARGMGWEWPPSESDKQAATSVAEELGYHPIALVQAISYMSKTGYSAETYISRLRSYREDLLRDPATSQIEMRYKTAFAAFEASYALLSTEAQHFLHLLSLLHSQKFPLELVIYAAENEFSIDRYRYLQRGDEFAEGVECLKKMFCPSGRWNPVNLDSVITLLRNHSLLTVTPSGDTTLLHMHSLIHEWARFRICAADIARFQAAAIRLLCCGARDENYTMMQYLINHVRALSSTWNELHANDAGSFAFLLRESGIYAEASELQKSALEAVEHGLGKDHPDSIRASANLAGTYCGLGRFAEAEILEKEVLAQRTQLLGKDHPDTITAAVNLAGTYCDLGRFAEAEILVKEVLAQSTQLLGKDHPDTILASANLAATYHHLGRYAKAEVLQKEVLVWSTQLLGKDHPNTIGASANLASTYCDLGRYAEAEILGKEVLAQRTQLLGKDHPDSIRASENLAGTYCDLGRFAEAEILEKEVLAQRTQLLGKDHPDTITAAANLATTYRHLGRYGEAEILEKEVLAQRTQLLEKDHPDSIRASANLAGTYRHLGRFAEAEILEMEVLAQRTQLLGKDHPDTITAAANLAGTYRHLGRYGEAEILEKEVLAQSTQLLGKDHPDTITAAANLAATYRDLGRYGEAEILEKEVLAQRTQLLGKDHPDTITAAANLAATYRRLGRFAEAEILVMEVLAQSTQLLGKDHPDTITAAANLAVTYRRLGRFAEAEILGKDVLAQRTQLLGKDHPNTITTAANLAATYRDLGRYGEAEILEKEVLAQRTQLLGKDHPDSISASANLAGTYRHLGRFAEAEILEMEVLAQITQLLGKDHPDTITAAANLAATYRDLGRYGEAEILEKEVLAQSTQLLGKDHPDTITAAANLAATYRDLGRYGEAEILEKEVLAQRTQLLGKDHPDTITAAANLAATYYNLGRYVEALSLGEEVLNQRTRLLGVAHPQTLHAMVSLGYMYSETGKLLEAYDLGERARRIALETRGEDDPEHQYACRFLADLGEERDQAVPQPNRARRDRFLARLRRIFS